VTKPGACGYTDEFPDGRRQTLPCETNVQQASAPFPIDNVSNKWLESQNVTLLSILRSMLDAASLNNYLVANELQSLNAEQRFVRRLQTIQALAVASQQ